MKPLLGVTVLLLLASAAGCSASTPTAEKSEGPPKNGGSYESPVDIINALDEAGLECSGLSEMTGADDPAMTQNCTGNGDNIIVRIIDDRGELEAERETFDGAGIFKGKTMLVGENWNLVGQDSYVEDAHEKLGGDLVEGG